MVADERTYRLEPLDTSGVFLGLNAVQCALMGAGMLLGVVAISAGLPVPVAVVPLAGAAMVSFARVAGHPVWEWVPLGASWLWAGAGRGRRWTAPLPLWPTDVDRPPPLPPCLAGLAIVEVPLGPGPDARGCRRPAAPHADRGGAGGRRVVRDRAQSGTGTPARRLG